MAIRVLLVAPYCLVREGLRALLQSEPARDIEILGEVKGDPDETATTVAAVRPDVVLLHSLGLSENVLATILRIIRERQPDTPVLILAARPEIDQFQAAMSAGAAGYELIDISTAHLANAIRAVHDGKITVNQAVLRRMAETFKENGHSPDNLIGHTHGPISGSRSVLGLTSRECQVLVRIANGLGDKEIAAQLFLSEATVKSHLRTIYAKLRIRNRAQAAAFAVQQGLVPQK